MLVTVSAAPVHWIEVEIAVNLRETFFTLLNGPPVRSLELYRASVLCGYFSPQLSLTRRVFHYFQVGSRAYFWPIFLSVQRHTAARTSVCVQVPALSVCV